MEKKVEVDEVVIDGHKYVRADKTHVPAQPLDGMDYVIVRTYSAGVFAGYLKHREGREVTLYNARRIWHWDGAASLSQLAMEGTKAPDLCKLPCEVDSVVLTEAIEVINCSEKARISIKEVPIWAK